MERLPPHVATAEEPIESYSGDRRDGPDMRLAMPIETMLANLRELTDDDVGYIDLWRQYLKSVGLSLHLQIDKEGERHLQIGSPADPQIRHRWRWMHFLVRDLDEVEDRRPLLIKLMQREGVCWDQRPVNRRAVTAAMRDFLRSEGRILVTPDGRVEEGAGIPSALLGGTDDEAAACLNANHAFFDVRHRFKADPQIKRAVQMLGHKTNNGWWVLEAARA